MKTDPIIIEINDDDRPDDRPVEKPVFTIESDKDPKTTAERHIKRRGVAFITTMAAIGLLAVCALVWWATKNNTPEYVGIASDDDNITALRTPYYPSAKGTTLTSDSVLGVALNMYSLDRLKASLEKRLPNLSDSTLVLFMRSADYHTDNSMIGTVVVNGERLAAKSSNLRSGYLAISAAGKPVIGISESDKVADFVRKRGGSFFRQYPLLANGVLPTTFDLHGKVERSAIGRMPDGELFYIVTPHKETMYDFADALREYGFADAIYITGGNNYSFFRTPEGTPHIYEELLPKLVKYGNTATPPPAPFLVFRNI